MRTALFVAALGLAGSAMAQMPLPAFGSTFTAGLTRGFWFQAPVDFLIVGLAVPNEALQSHQVIEVINLGAAPPAFPGTVVGTQLFYSNNSAGGTIIPTAIPVTTGTFIGILGACTSGIGSATSYNSYTSTLGPFASDILGIPTTITRFGTQFGIGAGGNQPCWQEAAFNVSRVEVYVAPLGGGTIATNTTLGAGCPAGFDSFYENFGTAAAAGAALSGNVLFLSPNGSGYQGVWAPGAATAVYVPPVAATPIAVLDDNVVAYTPTIPLATPYGPQATLQVSGNAIIGFGAGMLDYPGTSSYTPTPAGFLNATLGGIYAWHDYNSAEAGSGPVVAEEIGGTLHITFNDVESYANPETQNRSTLQFQLELASGNVRLVWLNVDTNSSSVFGSSHLVGVTAPGPSPDPGSITLSTATSAQLATASPLTLSAVTRPVTGTSWNLLTGTVPLTGVIGVDVFGLSDPGINDLFFIGMPGCGLRASLDAMSVWPVTGSTHAYSLAIPANPTLVGADVFTTSAVFQVPPINPFGAISANGIKGHIGDL